MDLILQTLQSILPVFLVLLVGMLLRKIGWFSEQTRADVVKMVFYVGTPATIIKSVSSVDFGKTFDVRFIGCMVGLIVAVIFVDLLLCLWVKDRRIRGAMIQLGFRSNFAIIGMPLAQALLDADGVALTAVALSFAVIVFNVSAVIVLSVECGGEANLKKVLLNILKNPLIIATLIGLFCSICRVPFGPIVTGTLTNLGYIATCMGLIVIGASIRLSGFAEKKKYIFYSVFLRNLLAPLCIIGGGILFGFRIIICAGRFIIRTDTAHFCDKMAFSAVHRKDAACHCKTGIPFSEPRKSRTAERNAAIFQFKFGMPGDKL